MLKLNGQLGSDAYRLLGVATENPEYIGYFAKGATPNEDLTFCHSHGGNWYRSQFTWEAPNQVAKTLRYSKKDLRGLEGFWQKIIGLLLLGGSDGYIFPNNWELHNRGTRRYFFKSPAPYELSYMLARYYAEHATESIQTNEVALSNSPAQNEIYAAVEAAGWVKVLDYYIGERDTWVSYVNPNDPEERVSGNRPFTNSFDSCNQIWLRNPEGKVVKAHQWVGSVD